MINFKDICFFPGSDDINIRQNKRLSSHFVVIIDLIFVLCGMLYDIIRIKLLDIKIMPMKVDFHYLKPFSKTVKNVDDA